MTCWKQVHQERQEASERFRKLISISHEFDPSIFEGELVDDVEDATDDDNTHRGRKLLQAVNANDRNGLLVFKQGITLDQNETLQTWNTSANVDHCAWYGVTCSNRTGRVIGLNLTGTESFYVKFRLLSVCKRFVRPCSVKNESARKILVPVCCNFWRVTFPLGHVLRVLVQQQ